MGVITDNTRVTLGIVGAFLVVMAGVINWVSGVSYQTEANAQTIDRFRVKFKEMDAQDVIRDKNVNDINLDTRDRVIRIEEKVNSLLRRKNE